ncbi:MAG: Ig-like domain-containing protein [Clostridia bacterium]|nr:Ig-like domain-containing protein [Clostridia bacterium]
MDSRRLSTKILSVILCAVMMLSAMPLGVISAFVSSGTVPEGYTGIYDIEDLYLIRYNLEGNYILMADIDMTEATAEGGEWDSGSGWAPIGETSSAPFKGIFDGNGHKITGMRIKNSSVTYVGLFGYINGGTVKNLRMVNADIQDSSVYYAGTIAGYANSATFENIAVDNLAMNLSYASGECYFGGIVGYTNGASSAKTTISKSYVSGSITASCRDDYVGGIAGYIYQYTDITDCYNAATITGTGYSSYYVARIGGISGYKGTITNCVNIGTISGSNAYIGAINSSGATLSECYYKQGTASSGKYNTIDGLATVNSLTEEQMKFESVYGWLDFENTWVLDVASGADYPQLQGNRQFAESGIRPPEDEHNDVIPEGYTAIYDIEDLYAVRYNLEGNYILMADIDMTEDTAADGDWSYDDDGWRPIGPNDTLAFKGVFDGNGHEIIGMRIKNSSVTYVGLFGYINGGTVKNLRMVDADIADVDVRYAGTIAGYANSATLENIAIDNLTMNVEDDNSTSNSNNYGGIVGYTNGTSSAKTIIKKSYVAGSITVTGYNATYLGGIVGHVSSYTNISDCYNASTITASSTYVDVYTGGISGYNGTITNCVNVGALSGSRAYIGAINSSGATLSECYYKQGTASSGKYNTTDTAATAVALTETQMKLQAVFGYLDFENTWFLDAGSGKNYPQLISCPETIAERLTISAYPSKTTYLQHEDFDISGLKISVKYQGVETPSEKPATMGMLSGYDATAVGTQTITVTYLGKTATFDVIVSPRPVTSVTLDMTDVTLEEGMTQQLTATVLPDNATDRTIRWTSDNAQVATVDSNGLVTATGTGTATVIATATGGIFETATITVAADHIYGDTVTTITATCVAAGAAHKTCSTCGHVENIVLPIDSSNHTGGTEVRDDITGNCGEAGYTGDTYCLGCNTKIADGEEIPATENHDYDSEITTPSTCTVQGVITYTCTVCEDTYTEAAELDADAHTWGEPEVIQDATCEEDGYKAALCTECGAEAEGTVVVPSSEYPESYHNYSNYTNTTYNFSYPGATELHLTFSYSTAFEYGYDYLYIYNEDGSRYGYYTGSQLSGKTITLEGDSFSLKLTADGSNTAYGFSFTKIEAVCDGVTEVIPATGHDYTDAVTTGPTCVDEGVRTYTCSVCGDSYTEDIDTTPDTHDMSDWEIVEEATCNSEGLKVKKCADCGYVYSSRITLDYDTYPESSHSYPSNADFDYDFSYEGATALYLTFSYSTEFESGYDYLYIFDGEGEQIGRYTGSALEGTTITVPGDSFSLRLTSDGSYNYYGFSFSKIEADVAVDSENSEVIPATGEHDYVATTTKEATCTQEGEITYICSYCDDSYTETTETTAHTEVAMPDTAATCSVHGTTGGKQCSVCGAVTEEPTETELLPHTEVDKPDTAPTCTAVGTNGGTMCSVCGVTMQAPSEIPMIPHTEEAIPDRAATCTQNGSQGGKQCTVCGTVTVEPTETPKADHTPGEWQVMVEATVDTDGMKMRCCTVCGAETDRETIPAGTTSDGKPIGYLGDANNDGKVTAADARLILRHSAKIEILPETVHHLADVNGDGKINASDARIALRMASKLEGLFYYGSGDFHIHEYETTIDTEATCTTDGKETKTCKICGETKTSTIPKKGHAWKNATCTAPKTCTNCGATEGSAKGHNYVSSSCIEPSKCTNCGATSGAAGYHYSDKNFRCTRCGKNLSGFTDSFIQVGDWFTHVVDVQTLMIDNYGYRDYYDVVAYAIEAKVYLQAILEECDKYPEFAAYESYVRKVYNKLNNALASMTDSNGNIRTTESNAYKLIQAIDTDNEILAIEEWNRIYDNTFAHLSN